MFPNDSELKSIISLLDVLVIVSNVAVFVGVYLERDTHSEETRKEGWLLVAKGLAAEIAFGLFLLVGNSILSGRQAKAIEDQRSVTAKAQIEAAAANTKAVTLLAENVELERALAPRDFEQSAIAIAIADKPRVPILIAPLGEEEPIKVAKQLFFAIKGIKVGNAAPWDVAFTSALEWTPEGITIRYGESFSSSEQNDGKKVAISLCEAMRAQGYAVIASRVPLDIPEGARASEWPVAAPKNAVVVSIGQKPNHFWQNKQLLQKGMRPIPDMSYCTSDEAFQQSDAEFKAKREQRQNDTPPK